MTKLCFALSLILFCSSPCFAESFTGKVVGVADGDTITVLHDNRPEKIRLAGIDCPEKKQAFGQQAKSFTAAAIFGKEVTVTTIGKDRYGRSIGEVVEPDGTDLNLSLVEHGLAWHYTKYDHRTRFDDVEASARKAKIGLWLLGNPTPPWQWRHAH